MHVRSGIRRRPQTYPWLLGGGLGLLCALAVACASDATPPGTDSQSVFGPGGPNVAPTGPGVGPGVQPGPGTRPSSPPGVATPVAPPGPQPNNQPPVARGDGDATSVPQAMGDVDAATPTDTTACAGLHGPGHLQLEALDRGLVALRIDGGNYVGWRMLASEYSRDQPGRVAYAVHRDGNVIAVVEDSTNYVDRDGGANAQYAVSLVIDGVTCEPSATVSPWSQPYLEIPLSPPSGGTTFVANDGSPGDLDGDGQYELVLKWDPANSKDNSQSGRTDAVYIDAYELDGTRLWRMNLGPNVRAGAHYTQFLVYDLDGDGRAEVALRTAPGTRDATGAYLSTGPAANDDDGADYRNGDGYVLSGPEYLTVFDGQTGRELATVPFQIERGSVGDWGDNYGNRVDRFLASVAFVSDGGDSGAGSGRPALLMARGYYTRATVTAWSFRDGDLSRIWTADSQKSGSSGLAGQGAHSMAVADVDGDGAQEVIYGAAMIESDGSFGCSTGLGHGDALHVDDLIPSRPGLEVFMPHEDKSKDTWDIRDARTCEIIHRSRVTGSDNGRGVAADILPEPAGAEMWSSSDSSLRAASTGAAIGGKPRSTNFLVYWDGDRLRELEDGTSVTKGDGRVLLTCDACASNNGTKSTPTLTADLFGDWREEIVWRTSDGRALRVYTTTIPTDVRLYTLMHDPQYRMQVSAEQTAYNQPPHLGFALSDDAPAPPEPDAHYR